MMNVQKSVGPIVGMFLKPRYAVIKTFLGGDLFYPPSLDIFIDLNTVLGKLSTSGSFLRALPFAQNVEHDIIEAILGAVKHWKDFTRNYNSTKIYLMVNDFDMDDNIPERKVIKNYLMSYTNKYKEDRYAQLSYYWNESMKIIETVLKYVPGTYLVKCKEFDSYMIPKILGRDGGYKIIVTDNSLMTNYILEENTKVFLMKFKNQLADPSMIVQSVSNIDEEIMTTFIRNKVFYSMLNGIIGDRDRGIIGITQIGISSFANDLLRSYERGEISQDPKSIESVLPVVKEDSIKEYFRTVYPLIDVQSHLNLIPPSAIEKVKSRLVDLYDIDGLSKIRIGDMNLTELL